MFLNVRGTFGSGKTTVAWAFMDKLKEMGGEEHLLYMYSELLGKEIVFGHEIRGATKLPVVFVGKYDKERACSGCDTISYKGAHNEIEAFIENSADVYHFFVEGSIASTSSRYTHLSQRLVDNGKGAWMGFMGTNMEEAERRVLKRRKEKHEAKVMKAREKGRPDPELKEFNNKNLVRLFTDMEGKLKQVQETTTIPHDIIYSDEDFNVGQKIVDIVLENENRLFSRGAVNG